MNDDDRIRALLSKVNSDFAQATGTVIIPPEVSGWIIKDLERLAARLADLKKVNP